MVTVELIHTGTELLLGARWNRHAWWLSRRLHEMGYTVMRQTTVPDRAEAIREAVAEGLGRADLVIVTGGLGPTSDDCTREEIARLLGRPLREDPEIRERLEAFYAARGRPMPARSLVQALVPEGARVLPNARGTAPGLALEIRPNPFRNRKAGVGDTIEDGATREGRVSWLVLLPGPTAELQQMFDEWVVPLLRQVLPVQQEWAAVTLRTVDLGESILEQQVVPVLEPWLAAGLEVGYCATPGQVDLRLSARGEGARALVAEAERVVRELLGMAVFGRGEETLEAVVLELLRQRGQTLAVAESCTGGGLAHRLTNVPGASTVFLAGWVTYSNAAKVECLGVDPDALVRHGAVSEAVARQMAEGARRRAQSTYALATTGIAGPSGGTPEKPVGTVYVALAGPPGTKVVHRFNPAERETFKAVTITQGLDLLRRTLLKEPCGV